MVANAKYHRHQIALHWLILLLLIITYSAMEFKGIVGKESVARGYFYKTHFFCGLSILVLMLIRLGYKLSFKAPPITPKPPLWQEMASTLVQVLIYGMFIALPILGFMTVYLSGHDWTLLSISMPTASEPNPALRFEAKSIHEFLANAGYYLIGLHTLAALFHHYVMKDNTLLRIMPNRAR